MRATEADRATLSEILARPEFRDRPIDASWLRQRLGELWDRLLEALGTAEAERYASLGRLVFLAAVGAAGLLLWRAARARAARRARPATTSALALPEAAAPGALPDPAAAERALAEGDLAAAVRRAFACAAAALGARGLAGGGAALTGPELAAAAGDDGFASLARLHDRTVFGRRPVAEPEARAAVEVARRLAAPRAAG